MVKKILLVAIIALISTFPLLSKGLPPTHDGEYHVIRFYEFYKTLADGNLYPRWAPDLNNGFGVPLFNYVYPFPNYFSATLHTLNFSFIDSFKLNMFFAMIIGSIFFFLWAREFWGDLGGVVASSFYSFSPYHLLDIYIRGSVGEVWALAFFPAFLWSITKFIKDKKLSYCFYSSIFFAIIVFSHNILAFMFLFFSILYATFILLIQKQKISISKLIIIFALGIGLSAIFWLPAILEKQYVKGLEVYDYSSNFPEFYQLIIPSWGSGFSGGTLQNELSFQIGIANLLVVFLNLFFIFKKHLKVDKRIIWFFLISFISVFILMLEISSPIWKVIPFFNYFQFPWRFLSLEILICSFLAGSTVFLWKGKILALILITIAVLLGIGYTKPAYYHMRNDNYYISRSNFIDGTNSPGNAFNTIWAGSFQKQQDKITVTNGKISNLSIKSTRYSFDADISKDSQINVNTAYFPGWKSYEDGKEVNVVVNKTGNFSFQISKGKHIVVIQFEDTNIRKLAISISFISVVIILLYFLRSVRIKK